MNAPLVHVAAALAVVMLVVAPSPSRGRDSAHGGRPDSLVVDTRASVVQWQGAHAAGGEPRAGSARFSGGLLVIRHEMLESGAFTIATRPAARFMARSAERVGPARWRVRGDLVMGGATRPLAFDADVRWAGVGHMVATTRFTIDSAVVSVTIDALRRTTGVASRDAAPPSS